MTDAELIARLRDEHVAASRTEAADRIEALTEQLTAARQDAVEAEAYAGELEAKLAKAEVINKLLTFIAILNDPNDERFSDAVDLAERFSATLAEIKGESHE